MIALLTLMYLFLSSFSSKCDLVLINKLIFSNPKTSPIFLTLIPAVYHCRLRRNYLHIVVRHRDAGIRVVNLVSDDCILPLTVYQPPYISYSH